MKDVNLLKSNGVNVDKSVQEIFGDMATYDETLVTFLAEVEGKLSRLKQFKETADLAQYAIVVHSLKSDAKYFGFEKLAEISYQHEMESKANNLYYITDNFDILMVEANRIVTLVKQYLGQSPVGQQSGPVSAPNPEVQSTPAEPIETLKEKSILVVDDSDIIRNFVKKIFANEYEVLLATDGAEAIEMVKNNPNILGVLLDLNMPNVDGFAVLDYFKENNLFATTPVAIITGNDTRETDQRAFEYPIIDMLKKPFNELSVKSIIERITLNSKK